MTLREYGRPVTMEAAREAKELVQRIHPLARFIHGIGIGLEDGDLCVRVNLGERPPQHFQECLPASVTTSAGDVVQVVYRVTGPIRSAAYA